MFSDIKGHWAESVIGEAAKLGLAGGYPDGTFQPDKPISRAEAIALALRQYNLTHGDFADIIPRVLPSVVQVINGEFGTTGSGTIVSPKGHILTNFHVISHKNTEGIVDGVTKNIAVQVNSGQYLEATQVVTAPEQDLALFKIDAPGVYPAIKLGFTLKQGDPVMAIGSPLSMFQTVTQGIVSSLDRSFISKTLKLKSLIQIDCPINPGNSGGCLIDLSGHMVGVPTLKYSHVTIDDIGFAIGLVDIVEFLEYGLREG